jgi:hypothetical protein
MQTEGRFAAISSAEQRFKWLVCNRRRTKSHSSAKRNRSARADLAKCEIASLSNMPRDLHKLVADPSSVGGKKRLSESS